MQSMHLGNIQSAFSSHLPPAPEGFTKVEDLRNEEFGPDFENIASHDRTPRPSEERVCSKWPFYKPFYLLYRYHFS